MRLRVSKIAETAAHRPHGYFEAVIARGVLSDCGEWLELSSEAHAELRSIYRQPSAEPPLPPLAERARNLASQSIAETSAILRGVPPITEEEAARRIAICKSNSCGKWRMSDETCSECGCPMARKAPWRSARCPLNYW